MAKHFDNKGNEIRCVYLAEFEADEHCYIGTANDYERRIREHLFENRRSEVYQHKRHTGFIPKFTILHDYTSIEEADYLEYYYTIEYAKKGKKILNVQKPGGYGSKENKTPSPNETGLMIECAISNNSTNNKTYSIRNKNKEDNKSKEDYDNLVVMPSKMNMSINQELSFENNIDCPFSNGTTMPLNNNVSLWTPKIASVSRIQPIPGSEYKKVFLCHNKNGEARFFYSYDVRFYHTGRFYSRIEDIPNKLTACDLISVSPFSNKFIYASIKDPSISTITELRKACVANRKTVRENPINFDLSKYGIIYKDNPVKRKIGKYKNLPIEVIIEIVKWIFEDYTIPIHTHNFFKRLNNAFIKNIDHRSKCEKEEFYSIFAMEEYHILFDNYTDIHYSLSGFNKSALEKTIDDIYFKGYYAYRHETLWLQHPELKNLGDYLSFINE